MSLPKTYASNARETYPTVYCCEADGRLSGAVSAAARQGKEAMSGVPGRQWYPVRRESFSFFDRCDFRISSSSAAAATTTGRPSGSSNGPPWISCASSNSSCSLFHSSLLHFFEPPHQQRLHLRERLV